MAKSLYPDQDRRFVGTDQSPNHLQMLSADKKVGAGKERVNKTKGIMNIKLKRGSCMVWVMNMGVCPRLDFENIILFNCLGYNVNIYGAFEFFCNSIANL